MHGKQIRKQPPPENLADNPLGMLPSCGGFSTTPTPVVSFGVISVGRYTQGVGFFSDAYCRSEIRQCINPGFAPQRAALPPARWREPGFILHWPCGCSARSLAPCEYVTRVSLALADFLATWGEVFNTDVRAVAEVAKS